jgi:hypothetical protein
MGRRGCICFFLKKKKDNFFIEKKKEEAGRFESQGRFPFCLKLLCDKGDVNYFPAYKTLKQHAAVFK